MGIVLRTDPTGYSGRLSLLKKLFWLYFFLLVFEGALRKWVVPQLSAPLLIIRDPVAVLIIWEAYRTHKWPRKWASAISVLSVALVGLCVLQMTVADNPWFAGVYGLRSYLLPFPVAFIMGENLDEEDLRKFGACMLWLLLPLTALEAVQYLSPAASLVNKGAYEGAAQIGYSGDHVRASGTFSYVAGPINFNFLTAAFIFYGLINERFVKKWLLWAAAFALILSVPIIGARTLVFELGAVLVSVGVGAFLGVSQFAKTLRIIVPILFVSLLVAQLPIFSDAMASLTDRFTAAAAGEGGSTQESFVIRTILPFENAFQRTDFASNLLGQGMGRGAAAISALLTGTPSFLAGESELDREIDEFGPISGIAFLLFRLALAAYLLGHAVARARDHEPLALLLVPTALIASLFGILEQPTGQGFMVFGIAITLAAINSRVKMAEPAEHIRFHHALYMSSRGKNHRRIAR